MGIYHWQLSGPSEEELGQKIQYVGFDKASLTGNTLTLLPGMEIDLGAVAKGYACDLITEELRANGVTSGITAWAAIFRQSVPNRTEVTFGFPFSIRIMGIPSESSLYRISVS